MGLCLRLLDCLCSSGDMVSAVSVKTLQSCFFCADKMTAYIDRGPTQFPLPSPRGAATTPSPRTRTQSSLAARTEEGQESGKRGARLTSSLNSEPMQGLVPRVAHAITSGVPYAGYVHDPAASTRPRSFFEELCLSPRKLSPRARLPKLQSTPGASPVLRSKAKVGGQGQWPKVRTSLTSFLTPSEAAEDLPLELLNDVRWILFPATQVKIDRSIDR